MGQKLTFLRDLRSTCLSFFEARNDTFLIERPPKSPFLKKYCFDLSDHQPDTLNFFFAQNLRMEQKLSFLQDQRLMHQSFLKPGIKSPPFERNSHFDRSNHEVGTLNIFLMGIPKTPHLKKNCSSTCWITKSTIRGSF